MSQQAIALWKSQLPSYDKIINRCCYHIQTPLTQFLPPYFEDRIKQLRETIEVKQPEQFEPYISIICHFIEGRKNKSIIQLADLLVQQFGGSLKYWQNVILDVGEQVSYTSDLSLWHVRKLFQQKLYVDPENLSNYRRLCKLAKSYLSTLANLIKYITKFDSKKDTIAKIDDLFKKVKLSEEKYVGFCQQINNLQQSNTFDEVSNNISQKSKQNAVKNLFNFRQPAKIDKNEKTRNTLLNYNFRVITKQGNERISEPTKNIKQTCKQLTGDKMEQFQRMCKNIKAEWADFANLRSQFERSKQQYREEKMKGNQTNLATIWDKDYYFSYLAHPIQLNNFTAYTQPFTKHEWVNYEIQSDQQYQDLLGEDVDNNSEMSQASSLTKNSFVVSDDHLSEDQNLDANDHKQIKPTISNTFGERWSFSKESEPPNCLKQKCEMIVVDYKSRLPLQVSERSEIEQMLYRVVDGKDKATIMQVLSKQKIKVSKSKLKQFLDKKCKAMTDGNKTIFKIIELQDENIQRENEYIPDPIQVQNEKQDLNDTAMYVPEYFPQPAQRMPTRRSKKQSSEKLTNQNASVVNGLRSRTSGKKSI